MATLLLSLAILAAPEAIEPLSNVVFYGLDKEGKLSRIPVTAEEDDVPVLEKAIKAGDIASLAAMEAKGRITWIPAGTRAVVLKGQSQQTQASGSSAFCEVRMLDGPRKDQTAWVAPTRIRRLPPITGEIKVPEGRDLHTPEGLALTLLDRDQQAFRELVQAVRKADEAAKKLPRSNPHRRARFDRVLKEEIAPVGSRYHLTRREASKILSDGQLYRWPTDP
jgi:hypothetical protein